MPMKSTFLTLASVLALIAAAAIRAQDAGAFERAYAQRDWAAAAKAAELWAGRDPGDSTAAYNAACAHALAGDPQAALEWLRRAGAAGFAGVRSIEEDPDLASVRDAAGFAAATAAIRSNRERLFEEFRTEAERSQILTLLPPEGLAGPRPLIVVLHGYGDKPERNAGRFREAAAKAGAILAAPSALRPGPQGRGFSWTFRDEAEWWVLRAIERIGADHPVDPEKVILAGFSQGANVALTVGLKHPRRFAGLLPIGGHYEAHLMPAPDGGGPRVYLLTGDEDPFAYTFRTAAAALRGAGLEVRLRMVPGLGHDYPRRATKELGKALEFLLR
jgi:phospholipase/carboxylesterase